MGRPDDFRSLCYVAVKSGHPALAAAHGAERHISTGATLRFRFLTVEIRSRRCRHTVRDRDSLVEKRAQVEYAT